MWGNSHKDEDDHVPERDEGHEIVELVGAVHGEAQWHDQEIHAKQDLREDEMMIGREVENVNKGQKVKK